MDNVRNFSLADHTISIITQSGAIQLQIGNGDALESITVSFENDTFSFTMSADGNATLNKNYMRNGSISLSVQQTNPCVERLIDLYKTQMLPGATDIATIKIKDVYGNINARLEKCVVTKIPDYTANTESSPREFTIIFGQGTMSE